MAILLLLSVAYERQFASLLNACACKLFKRSQNVCLPVGVSLVVESSQLREELVFDL